MDETCSICDYELDGCDECSEEFTKGETVTCYDDGEQHFCSWACFHNFAISIAEDNAMDGDVE